MISKIQPQSLWVMANWFPMALKDSASSWLTNLPAESINTWEDLCRCFVTNFKGTYERGLTYNDLRGIRQKPGETLRKYIQHVGTVETRVPRAGLPGPTTSSEKFPLCSFLLFFLRAYRFTNGPLTSGPRPSDF